MNVMGTAALLAGLVLAVLGFGFHKTRRLAALALCSLLAWGVCLGLRQARFAGGFWRVVEGQSLAETAAVMGPPDFETDGLTSVYGDQKQPAERTPGCVLERWYVVFWFPEKYSLCFDAAGRLVGKVQFSLY